MIASCLSWTTDNTMKIFNYLSQRNQLINKTQNSNTDIHTVLGWVGLVVDRGSLLYLFHNPLILRYWDIECLTEYTCCWSVSQSCIIYYLHIFLHYLLSIHLNTNKFTQLSTHLSTHPPIHLSTYPLIYLSTYLPIYLSIYRKSMETTHTPIKLKSIQNLENTFINNIYWVTTYMY